MNEVGLYTLGGVSLMCLFLFLRHTRSEEETDRAELVRSAPVGRYATLTAAYVWVTILNLAVAAGLTIALLGFGLEHRALWRSVSRRSVSGWSSSASPGGRPGGQ